MTPLNAVISGYGVAGELHACLLAARADIRIVGIADPAPQRRALAQHQHPDAMTAPQLSDLDMQTDIIVIATPPHCHEAETRTALVRHHAHVLCEKPAVLDPAQGMRLARIAAEQQLAIWPVHNYLYAPAIRQARHLLRSSAIGRITHASVDIGRTAPSIGHTPWRTNAAEGGGILNDHGPHILYLLSYLLGQNADEVSCTSDCSDHGVEKAVRIELRYPSATAAVRLSWKSTLRQSRYQFHGTGGELILEHGALTVATPDKIHTLPADDMAAAGHTHTAWTQALHADFIAQSADYPSSHHWHQATQLAAQLQAARISAAADGNWTRVVVARTEHR